MSTADTGRHRDGEPGDTPTGRPLGGPTDESSARASCESLPWAELTNPFGDETDVFKVRGKIFALLTVGATPARVSLKCPPDHGAALVRQYESVIPGYHLNKKHWITITLGGDVPTTLVEDLIVNSYGIVIGGLPLSRRPPLALEARPGSSPSE